MAGGTGGHVFPGLAAARYFQQQGVEVQWLGTAHGLEARIIPEAGIPFHAINIGGVRGKGLKTLMLAPYRIMRAIMQAKSILKAFQPDVVVGMGGFVSGPGGVASWLCRTPLVIHEQNAKAGFTNRLLAGLAKRVLQGFPSAFAPGSKVMTIGNPVRVEIENLTPPQDRLQGEHKPLHLLVLGGSLGAKALNEVVPRALLALPKESRPAVIHQTGEKHFTETKNLYETMGIEANLKPFVKDMAEVYSWADVVLCRAGALTVAELCSAGVGAIFVPYPHAVDDHQTANAEYMVSHAAAMCIQQNDLTDTRLASIIEQFAASPEKRLSMAEAAYRLRLTRVTEKIFKICEEVSR